MKRLNTSKIVAHFGGVNELAKVWQDYFQDHSLTTAAIYKWRTRDSLPLNKLQKLVALADHLGKPLNLNKLLLNQSNTTESTKMPQTKQLYIFDTTLRDGEQSPGAAMTKEEKILIARQLEKLGVDIIEAGFAAASPGDFDAIHAVAQVIKNATVCSLARANEKDVRAAGEAIQPAAKKRIHTFIATSPLHMEQKLKMSPQKVKEAAVKAVTIAREYTDDVEFSAEDALRSEPAFLKEICAAVIEAGASTINIPDTVGYSIPHATEAFFKDLIEGTKGSEKVIWSSHAHNDLGMAVSNSLAAILGGARQVECTINGIGERAGNASLEEVVMAIKTRKDIFNLDTNIDTTQIVPTSKMVSSITGYPVQPNKAIVGANAFAHESGIHQDGVLKCRETYEIMSAQSVGWQTNRLTLGKLSGRNAFKTRLHEIGIELDSEEALNAAFARFKDLADKKREIYDEDLHALVTDELANAGPDNYKYISLKIQTETGEAPKAEIVYSKDSKEVRSQSIGSGPVDAVFLAIENEAKSGAQLQLYSVNAITEGSESQGEVTVRLSKDKHVVNGQGADTDILVATAKAYLSALSKLEHIGERVRAQGTV